MARVPAPRRARTGAAAADRADHGAARCPAGGVARAGLAAGGGRPGRRRRARPARRRRAAAESVGPARGCVAAPHRRDVRRRAPGLTRVGPGASGRQTPASARLRSLVAMTERTGIADDLAVRVPGAPVALSSASVYPQTCADAFAFAARPRVRRRRGHGLDRSGQSGPGRSARGSSTTTACPCSPCTLPPCSSRSGSGGASRGRSCAARARWPWSSVPARSSSTRPSAGSASTPRGSWTGVAELTEQYGVRLAVENMYPWRARGRGAAGVPARLGPAAALRTRRDPRPVAHRDGGRRRARHGPRPRRPPRAPAPRGRLRLRQGRAPGARPGRPALRRGAGAAGRAQLDRDGRRWRSTPAAPRPASSARPTSPRPSRSPASTSRSAHGRVNEPRAEPARRRGRRPARRGPPRRHPRGGPGRVRRAAGTTRPPCAASHAWRRSTPGWCTTTSRARTRCSPRPSSCRVRRPHDLFGAGPRARGRTASGSASCGCSCGSGTPPRGGSASSPCSVPRRPARPARGCSGSSSPRRSSGPSRAALGDDERRAAGHARRVADDGLVVARYVVRLEPLASAADDDLVAVLAPTLQRYLTGPLRTPPRCPDRSRTARSALLQAGVIRPTRSKRTSTPCPRPARAVFSSRDEK